MTNENFANFKSVQDWLGEVKAEKTGSEVTQTTYLKEIGKFCHYMTMNPDQLIEKARQEHLRELTSGLEKKTWAEKMAIQYFNDVADGKVETDGTKRKTADPNLKRARTTAGQRYGIVRSFFRYNGIVFTGKTPTAVVTSRMRLPEPEQLTKAWKAATLPERVCLGVARSTGWRPQDVVDLLFKDIRRDYESQAKRIYIEKQTQKEDLWVGVYLTEETTEILRIWIEERKCEGEQFTDETKIFPFTYDQFRWYIHNAGKRVGVKLVPKLFRKWFRTKTSGLISKEAMFKMAGWALPGVGKNYQLPTPEDTLERYMKIEYLLLFELERQADKHVQVEALANFAIAQGLPVEEVEKMKQVFRSKSMTVEDFAKEMGKKMKQNRPAGGLAYDQKLAQNLAQLLLQAIKEVREKGMGE